MIRIFSLNIPLLFKQFIAHVYLFSCPLSSTNQEMSSHSETKPVRLCTLTTCGHERQQDVSESRIYISYAFIANEAVAQQW